MMISAGGEGYGKLLLAHEQCSTAEKPSRDGYAKALALVEPELRRGALETAKQQGLWTIREYAQGGVGHGAAAGISPGEESIRSRCPRSFYSVLLYEAPHVEGPLQPDFGTGAKSPVERGLQAAGESCPAMVKLGFLGCGYVGQGVHLPNFLATGKCEVVALAEARPKLASKVAERHGIPRVYPSQMELALDPEVQAVAAITSVAFNRETTVPLLRAGKHVFIEKPVAPTSAEGHEMIAAAREGRAMLMVAYMKRYDPGIQWAKERIAQFRSTGEMGELLLARAHCFGGEWTAGYRPDIIRSDELAPPAKPRTPEWLPDELRMPYLTFNNVFCHDLNVLRFLLEPSDTTVAEARYSGKAFAVLLEMDGLPVTLETGFASGTWEEEADVYFEKCRMRIKMPPPLLRQGAAHVTLWKEGTLAEVFAPAPSERSWAFFREAEYFLDCVSEGKQPLSPGEDSVIDVELAEAVFRRLMKS